MVLTNANEVNVMEFGEYLRAVRERKGFSIRQLASLAGVSNAYLSQIETGQRGIPSPDIIKKLAKPLGLKYEDLLAAAGYLERNDSLPLSDAVQTELRDEKGNSTEPTTLSLPDWVKKLPPDMQKFVEEESKHGWPYLRLARGLKMQDLTEEELRAIVETWQDAKRRHEKESGK